MIPISKAQMMIVVLKAVGDWELGWRKRIFFPLNKTDKTDGFTQKVKKEKQLKMVFIGEGCGDMC